MTAVRVLTAKPCSSPSLQPADGPVRRPHVHQPSAHRADLSRAQFLVDSFALNFCEQQLRGRLICSPEEIESMLKLHADNSCETYVEKTYRVEQINDMVSLAPQTRPAHSADAQNPDRALQVEELDGPPRDGLPVGKCAPPSAVWRDECYV